MIKAIETEYKGYKFRSRLEARWSIFFDVLGIEWEYEPEGFELPDGTRYLPDFWLPQVSMWAEVKAGEFSEEEKKKCELLAEMTLKSVLMLDGAPNARNYFAYCPNINHPACQDCEHEWDCKDTSCEKGKQFTYNGTEVWDFWLNEGHEYWKYEHRFYICCAYSGNQNCHEDGCICDQCDYKGAIKASRSARFEFGHKG